MILISQTGGLRGNLNADVRDSFPTGEVAVVGGEEKKQRSIITRRKIGSSCQENRQGRESVENSWYGSESATLWRRNSSKRGMSLRTGIKHKKKKNHHAVRPSRCCKNARLR